MPCTIDSSCCRLRRLPSTTLFPYTTLFRSGRAGDLPHRGRKRRLQRSDAEAHREAAVLDGTQQRVQRALGAPGQDQHIGTGGAFGGQGQVQSLEGTEQGDRKSTRLNSSHVAISY